MATKLSNDDIIAALKDKTLLEISDLVKSLEETFGISAASAVQYAAAPAASNNAPVEEAEEKTKFDLILTDAGAQKIAVIKVIRELLPELGLKEAKDLVDTVPKAIKEGISKEDVNSGKEKLEKAGAKAEIK